MKNDGEKGGKQKWTLGRKISLGFSLAALALSSTLIAKAIYQDHCTSGTTEERYCRGTLLAEKQADLDLDGDLDTVRAYIGKVDVPFWEEEPSTKLNICVYANAGEEEWVFLEHSAYAGEVNNISIDVKDVEKVTQGEGLPDLVVYAEGKHEDRDGHTGAPFAFTRRFLDIGVSIDDPRFGGTKRLK